MKNHIILLSGGSGSRMGAAEPKQFLKLGGIEVICHSARTLQKWSQDGELVCVAPPEWMEKTRTLLGSDWRVVSGGDTRHKSTLCGISALKAPAPGDVIYIHDAARPLITAAELNRLHESFAAHPGMPISSLAGPVHETIARIDGDAFAGIVPRDELRAVKTPQAFRYSAWAALSGCTGEFTDLLSWAARAGLPAVLAEAGPANIKMTTQADLKQLEALL